MGAPVNGSSSSGHVGGGSGGGAEDDGAADSADEFPPGAASPSPPTTTRSVSATLQYEREQRPRGVTSRASPRPSIANDSRSHHRNSHPPPPPPPQTHQQQQQQQQHNARDTFLNYFFGQNGPGPIVAASVGGHVGAGASAAGSADGMVPSGRDVSGAAQRSGLSLAGKLDGNSAAYDMKSLGKHIEAVSVRDLAGVCLAAELFCFVLGRLRETAAAVRSCRDGKKWRLG